MTQRNISRPIRQEVDQSYQAWYSGSEFPAIQDPGVISRTNWRTGSDQPNWRRLVASGLCATTTLEGSRTVFEEVRPGYLHVSNTANGHYGWAEFWPTLWTPGDPISVPSATADNQALARYVSEYNGVVTGFQGGNFLVELKSTLEGILHPARALRNALFNHCTRVKKRVRGMKGKKRRSFVRDSYLEATFGWQPLLSDIDSAMDALTRWNPPARLIAIHGKGKEEFAELSEVSRSMPPGSITSAEVRSVTTNTVKYRGRVRWDPSIQTDPWQWYGLTLGDVLPAVWEYIPYSFVADYVTNISDIISAWSNGFGYLAWTDRIVRNMEVVDLINHQYLYNTPGFTIDTVNAFAPAAYKTRVTYIKRSKYTGTLVPDFQWEIPGISSRKWLNLAALSKNARI